LCINAGTRNRNTRRRKPLGSKEIERSILTSDSRLYYLSLSQIMVYQPARRQERLRIRSRLSATTLLRATLLILMAATPVVLATRLIRSSQASESTSALPMTPQSTKAEIADRYGKLPLSFQSNEGQTDRDVKFLSHGPGYDLFLTAAGAVLTLRKPRPPAFTENVLSNH